MLADVVVDTNVLMHADNFQEPRQQDAQSFLLSLQESETSLCVDEGFDTNEANNRSHIGSEYLTHLKFGMLGFAVIAHLARSFRVREVSRSVPSGISKHIRMRVGNAQDRIFVRVAFNAEDKTLTSHDFTDLPQTVRQELSSIINVHIVCASEALSLLE